MAEGFGFAISKFFSWEQAHNGTLCQESLARQGEVLNLKHLDLSNRQIWNRIILLLLVGPGVLC